MRIGPPKLYTHPDAAENERGIGIAMKKMRFARDSLFVTLTVKDSRGRDLTKELRQSLTRLQLNYVDLYVTTISFPVPLLYRLF